MRGTAIRSGLAMLLAICGAASADPYVRVQSPSIGGIQTPPYGPGFGQGVIVGPRDGCRNYNCPPTDLQNRPAHRRYYENYFKVPEPTYSGQRKIRGNRALNPVSPESCAARYRSYRASDNTYQPFEGPRRPCSG